MGASQTSGRDRTMVDRNVAGLVPFFVALCACTGVLTVDRPCRASEDVDAGARRFHDTLGLSRGLVVVTGEGACELATQLAGLNQVVYYVHLPPGSNLADARGALDRTGLLNSRVYVEAGPLNRVPLADNLADAVLVRGQLPPSPGKDELLRVLRPGGKLIANGHTIAKPIPEGGDDWSHPYHGPDNNPKSDDALARWPYLTQFFCEPYFAPVPQVSLASGGRVFCFYGHVAFHEREEQWLSTLLAVNAYNGTILWKRKLDPEFLVHRNTKVATSDLLYYAEKDVCRVIDAGTGKQIGQIAASDVVEAGDDTDWKWLAIQDGVLYGVLGPQSTPVEVAKHRRTGGGWPWRKVSKGYNDKSLIWGFGRTVIAYDLAAKRVLWSHREDKQIDTRATCMKNDRLFLFRFGSYLTALNTGTGEAIWRKTASKDPEFFETFGEYFWRQGAGSNWKTVTYAKCSDRALYFAGPQMRKLLAVSTEDGSVLWEDPYDNYQLILDRDAVYAVPFGNKAACKKFEALTGKVLAEYRIGRSNCTRPTANAEGIYFRRQGEGTLRFDLRAARSGRISAMRPSCTDGVVTANGSLFWFPWVCDCNISMYGMMSVASAGSFEFSRQAIESERLETVSEQTSEFELSERDWPTYRARGSRTAESTAALADHTRKLWEYSANGQVALTAPVAGGGLVLLGGSDGTVRALDAATGQQRWAAYTGGAINYPPTLWRGAALVGSGDGWVYSFDMATGALRWRFRCAPVERKIPVYGKILSTWPAASGVLVDSDGTAYVAAGIIDYNGTHVYALDAATGRIKWQNNTAGHLDTFARCGVSVMGHLLLDRGKLYLAGGTTVSPAAFDASTGECLSTPTTGWGDNCGSELTLAPQGYVWPSGQPLYNTPEEPVFRGRGVTTKPFFARAGNLMIVWLNDAKLACYDDDAFFQGGTFKAWVENDRRRRRGLAKKSDEHKVWQVDCPGSAAIAVGANATVLVTGAKVPKGAAGMVETPRRVAAISHTDGLPLWQHELPGEPVRWGAAIDRNGRVLVALRDGRLICYGS